ncbi:hypothetical protein DFH08DRAFT_930319 [Mycena albidolilacea]|uniref:Uncharacterized protein n=1 Tax=Mycena albidolilacea TaxID=1033008 RepID=A0AAD7F3B3_9AGAR|nr:hypothetical protein DFH08DRAFT_930319 [Mycena albidolilacea]
MFKRVDKRRKRQEEEEELGLDEDMKEVLGLNDTDSDESDSDDNSESESEADDGADEVEGEEGDEEDDEDSSDEEGEEEPPISVEEALRDPVYVVSIEPDVKACITCPGKLLKNAEILRLHRASKAHDRRWRQFRDFAKSSNAPPSSNAWDVLKQRAEEQPKLSLTEGSAVSKRNQKREEQKAKNVARREKKREANAKRKAKEAAALASGADSSGSPQKDSSALKNTDSPASARPTKKRKLAPAPAPPSDDDDDDDDAAEAALPAPPPKTKTKTGRSPRRERLERQGKLQEKVHGHEPPGGRGKGNGKQKWAPGERGKQQKKDGGGGKSKVDRQKPLQIFD